MYISVAETIGMIFKVTEEKVLAVHKNAPVIFRYFVLSLLLIFHFDSSVNDVILRDVTRGIDYHRRLADGQTKRV